MRTVEEQELWEAMQIGDWLDVLFEDEETGERFFVELQKGDGEDIEDFIARCQEVADENFSDAQYIELVDSWYAEGIGYDTY